MGGGGSNLVGVEDEIFVQKRLWGGVVDGLKELILFFCSWCLIFLDKVSIVIIIWRMRNLELVEFKRFFKIMRLRYGKLDFLEGIELFWGNILFILFNICFQGLDIVFRILWVFVLDQVFKKLSFKQGFFCFDLVRECCQEKGREGIEIGEQKSVDEDMYYLEVQFYFDFIENLEQD